MQHHRCPEAPAAPAEERRTGLALTGGQVVAAHLAHLVRGQHLIAAAQQHPRERQQVVHRRHQPGGPVVERRRPAPLPGRRVPDHDAVRSRLVRRRQPLDVLSVEAGVAHAERGKDPSAQDLVVRRPDGSGAQHAQHVRAGVVEPPLTGLRQQGQLTEPGDPGIRVDEGVGLRRADRGEPGLRSRRDDRPRLGCHEHLQRHPEPERERQQPPHRHRSLGGNRVVERAVHPTQHPAVRELRQQPVDRLVQLEQALADQGQRRGRRDRLRRRRDPEQRRPLNQPLADREGPERLDVHLVAVCHQRDQSRNLVLAHVRGRDRGEACQPVLAQSHAHSSGHSVTRQPKGRTGDG